MDDGLRIQLNVIILLLVTILIELILLGIELNTL
jgi:hypothetical protein